MGEARDVHQHAGPVLLRELLADARSGRLLHAGRLAIRYPPDLRLALGRGHRALGDEDVHAGRDPGGPDRAPRAQRRHPLQRRRPQRAVVPLQRAGVRAVRHL